jgi:hypothetical protein
MTVTQGLDGITKVVSFPSQANARDSQRWLQFPKQYVFVPMSSPSFHCEIEHALASSRPVASSGLPERTPQEPSSNQASAIPMSDLLLRSWKM